MRARNIKPGFFKNENLADASHSARLLFIALWCLADKSGYVEYRPKRIKVEVFPYDDNINIKELLDELGNFLTFVGNTKDQFIQINNFQKHQSPHRNEKASDIIDLSLYQVITCNFKEFHPDCLIEDIRKEDSLTPDSDQPGCDKTFSLLEITKIYSDTFHDLIPSPLIVKKLTEITGEYNREEIETAFMSASSVKAKTINYIIRALKNQGTDSLIGADF